MKNLYCKRGKSKIFYCEQIDASSILLKERNINCDAALGNDFVNSSHPLAVGNVDHIGQDHANRSGVSTRNGATLEFNGKGSMSGDIGVVVMMAREK